MRIKNDKIKKELLERIIGKLKSIMYSTLSLRSNFFQTLHTPGYIRVVPYTPLSGIIRGASFLNKGFEILY